jgi:hypothetical protein
MRCCSFLYGVVLLVAILLAFKNLAAYACETVEQQTSLFNARGQLTDSQVSNHIKLWTLQNRIGGAYCALWE